MFSDLTWKKVFVWKNVGGGGLAHAPGSEINTK